MCTIHFKNQESIKNYKSTRILFVSTHLTAADAFRVIRTFIVIRAVGLCAIEFESPRTDAAEASNCIDAPSRWRAYSLSAFVNICRQQEFLGFVIFS